jgi:hypothetical protein
MFGGTEKISINVLVSQVSAYPDQGSKRFATEYNLQVSLLKPKSSDPAHILVTILAELSWFIYSASLATIRFSSNLHNRAASAASEVGSCF